MSTTTATNSPASTSSSEPSHTAELAALMRAGEALFDPEVRLYNDPYARDFVQHWALRLVLSAPPLARWLFDKADGRLPGIMGEALLRSRFFDDVLEEELAAGTEQIVILGAGYDSTACRLAGRSTATVYEVDEPSTQAVKRQLVASKHPDALEQLEFVACDFTRDRPSELLGAAGLDPSRRSLVSLLAVTMYVEADALAETLRDIATMSAPGSKLVLDYMHRSVVDGTTTKPGAQRAREMVIKRGEPYVFGLEPAEVAPWLRQFGFEIETQLEAAQVAQRYGTNARREFADFMGLAAAVRTGAAN
jgi:methyltransferase (TIGR00027 family)